MEKDYVDYGSLATLLAPQTQALQALAMRPQKTSATTTTTSTSTPYALEDLVATRNRIGESTKALDDALKARETFGYTLANALASAPQQQGAGSWLSDFARGFGSGMSARTNAAVDRAQKKYEAEMKDLADILAFDKAMGETTTQTQNQVIGYTPMEYGTAGGKTVAQGGPDQVVKNIATATGEGMDPEEFIKQYNTGGFIESGASDVDARDNPTLAARFIRSAVAPINTGARSALAQNMTDKIIGPKVQNMIQNMGGARGADTLREVSTRIGPLAQITSLGTQEQLGAISAAKTDVLDIINRDRAAVGMQPLTMEQFQPAWNRLFTGIATYNKQYGEKETNKKEKQAATQPVEAQEDYSKYGF
jgi:hypothetical protein